MAGSNGSCSVIPPSEHFFQLNEIRSATDSDFEYFMKLADMHEDGWVKKLDKNNLTIWQKETGVSSVKMAKVCGEFVGVSPGTAFDTILDGVYRKTWDENMIEDYEHFRLDDCNDVGYYSMRCPAPLRNRDFVNQRSWRISEGENQFVIFNHSVTLQDIPIKRKFIRGISYITGFLIRTSEKGCTINYVTQSDPKGKIPSWIINLTINQIAPSVFRKLYTACCRYEEWKSNNNPGLKPWRYPEQNTLRLLDVATLQGTATPPPSEESPEQEEDLPEDENEMKAIANKIAKQLSLDEETQNGSNGDANGDSNGKVDTGNGDTTETTSEQ